MASVDILYKGYYIKTGEEEQVCSTVTLVLDEAAGIRLIVDPGTVPDPGILVQELSKRGLEPGDIDIVFITHSHLDHHRFTGMFQQAAVLDAQGWWIKDGWKVLSGSSISQDIEVLRTPGHSDDSLTLLVHTPEGKVAVCGDVFWDKDYPEDDPFAVDRTLLQQNREMLLEIADFIIPGHAGLFAT